LSYADAMEPTPKAASHIGTLNEKALHAQLKQWLAEPGDRFEVPVGRHVIDIMRDTLLIEVQTGSTAPLRGKLKRLLAHHPIRLVIPIVREKTIIRLDEGGRIVGSRRSPKRGAMIDIFHPLTSLRELLGDSNFSVEGILVDIQEIRRPAATRTRRRQDWEVKERSLLGVCDRVCFSHPGDYLAIIPPTLEAPFNTADLALAIGRPRRIAQQIAYCLREMGALSVVERRRDGLRYVKSF